MSSVCEEEVWTWPGSGGGGGCGGGEGDVPDFSLDMTGVELSLWLRTSMASDATMLALGMTAPEDWVLPAEAGPKWFSDCEVPKDEKLAVLWEHPWKLVVLDIVEKRYAQDKKLEEAMKEKDKKHEEAMKEKDKLIQELEEKKKERHLEVFADTLSYTAVGKATKERLNESGKWITESVWIEALSGTPVPRVPYNGRLFAAKKFQKSDVKEIRDLQPEMERKMKRWRKDSPSAPTWIGSHTTAVLGLRHDKDKQPSLLAVPPDHTRVHEASIVSIMELERDSDVPAEGPSNAILGRVLDHAGLTIRAQRLRSFIVVTIVTERRVWFARVTGVVTKRGGFRATCFELSPAYNLNTPDNKPALGSTLLLQLIQKPATDPIWGYKLPALPGIKLTKQLGWGAEGIVFEGLHGPDDTQVAVKVFTIDEAESRAASERRNILQVSRMRLAGDVVRTPTLLKIKEGYEGQFANVTVSFPVGISVRAFFRDTNLTQKHARDLLYSIQEVHRAGLVHRDIRPSNIIVVDGMCQLIDMSMAAEVNVETVAEGTVTYACNAVVDAILDEVDVAPTFAHDLQSFVRCVWVLSRRTESPQWQNDLDTEETKKSLKGFWAKALTGPWEAADVAASKADTGALLDWISSTFAE